MKFPSFIWVISWNINFCFQCEPFWYCRQCGIERSKTFYEGLHKVPYVTIPLVINNMQKKDVEWREAKKGFDKMWHEACDKFYLKSLDFQGTKFKQNDVKQLRSKSLLKEIEALRDEVRILLLKSAIIVSLLIYKLLFEQIVTCHQTAI